MAILKQDPNNTQTKANKKKRCKKKQNKTSQKSSLPSLSSSMKKSNDEIITRSTKGIVKPLPSDILCGKDKSCVCHEGSVRFREVIESYQERYTNSTSKQEKMRITKEIVAKFDGVARFLKFNSDLKVWEEIDTLAARDKATHALRFATHKANLKSGGKASVAVRRRKSQSSNASSSTAAAVKQPSPEEIKLWKSLVLRQKELLTSIKNGESLEDVPASIELSRQSSTSTAISEISSDPSSSGFSGDKGDIDGDIDEDSGCKEMNLDTPQEEEGEEMSINCGQESEIDITDEFDVTPLPYYHDDDFQDWANRGCSNLNTNIVYENGCIEVEFNGDDMSDDIASILSEPLIEFELGEDGICEV